MTRAEMLMNEVFTCYENEDYVKAYNLALCVLDLDGNKAAALYYVGMCYHWGLGVAVNYAEAVKYYLKAVKNAEKDNQCVYSELYYNLAELYDKGLGVAKNKAEAIKWYRKAALVYPDARKRLKELGGN